MAGQSAAGREPEPQVVARARELAERFEFGDLRFFVGNSLMVRAAAVGEPKPLQETYQRLTDTIRRLGNPRLLESRICTFVPLYYVYRAEAELADGAIRNVQRLAELLNDAWMRRYAAAWRAIAAVELERRAEAQAALDEAFTLAGQVPSFILLGPLLAARAKAALKAGNRESALADVDKALARATQGPSASPFDEVVVRRARAEVLAGEAGAEEARRSVGVARQHGLKLQEASSLQVLAAVLLRERRAEAAQALEQAEAIFGALQCTQHLLRVKRFRESAAAAG
jgi:tetratricopeptide (TPR) repeat protein